MATLKTVPGSGYGNPLIDALIMGGKIWDTSTGPIKYVFGRGQSQNEFNQAFNGPHSYSDYINDYRWASTWWEPEQSAMNYALKLYENVSNIRFEEIKQEAYGAYTDANLVWWQTVLGANIGNFALMEGPNTYQQFGNQRWGYFDVFTDSKWAVNQQRQFGGAGLEIMIQTVGFALGLARPSDGGYQPDGNVFPGAGDGSLGSYGQNQSVYTVMSNNPGLSGPREMDVKINNGGQGGLGALDIAAIQALYGVNNNHATGNDVYDLPNVDGTGWYGIWDAGGKDTINGAHANASVTIDLRTATLLPNDRYAGGYLSRQKDIPGGFTIAKGVIIENAVGGRWDDKLVGNSASNTFTGGKGKDVFVFDAKPNKKTNYDTIKDFSVRDDSLWLDNKIFTKLGRKGSETKPAQLNKFFFSLDKAKDGNDYLIYNKKSGVLSYDADGAGGKAAIEIAKLTKGLSPTYKDFFVI